MAQEGGDHEFRLRDNQYVEWDPEAGMVYFGNEKGEVVQLNAAIMQEVSAWVHERNLSRYQLYYRRDHKDHIVVDGDTLCTNNVRLPRDEASDKLKPLPRVTEREWRFIKATGSLCSGCSAVGYRNNLVPAVPDGVPAFPCPECGEKTTEITGYHGSGIARHENGESHTFDFEIFERWRRGENLEKIESSCS